MVPTRLLRYTRTADPANGNNARRVPGGAEAGLGGRAFRLKRCNRESYLLPTAQHQSTVAVPVLVTCRLCVCRFGCATYRFVIDTLDGEARAVPAQGPMQADFRRRTAFGRRGERVEWRCETISGFVPSTLAR